MITFRQKGDFSKLTNYLERVKGKAHLSDLDKFGRAGVAALASATPVDSGLTASSWYYETDVRRIRWQFHFTTQIFKMEFQLPSFCSMAMELALGAG